MKSISNSWLLSKHKAIEIEFTNEADPFKIFIGYRTKGDHAGFRFVIALFGYDASFNLYDTRHWDYENDCYEIYEKETL